MADGLKLTRRGFLAGAALAAMPVLGRSQTPTSSPEPTSPRFRWPEPFQLTPDLSVMDWRLFPVGDEIKFIAEVNNHSEAMIVAPVVGVIVEHLPEESNFGWGSPYTNVIHPGDSTFIFGVAPSAVASDQDWGRPTWLICGDPENPEQRQEAIQKWDVSFETSWQVKQTDWLECKNVVTNSSDMKLTRMMLPGIVRDADRRICGATPIPALGNIEPGETVELISNVRPSYKMQANPFHLISDITGASASFSLQEQRSAINNNCPAVMPWNR